MIKKKNKEEIEGIIDGLRKLFEKLRKMKKKDITKQKGKFRVKRPHLRGKYSIKIGKGLKKFKPWTKKIKKRKIKRKRRIIKKKDPKNIFLHEGKDLISIGLDLPQFLEDIKIEKQVDQFKIFAYLPNGKINETFPIPKGYNLSTSYKAGILYLRFVRKSLFESFVDKFKLIPHLGLKGR